MILPEGISQAGSNKLMPDIEKLTNRIVKENYFKILDTMYYRYSLNYNIIFIEDSSKKVLKEKFIKIVVHANYPYIAFAKATKKDNTLDLDYYNFEFIDDPFLIKWFNHFKASYGLKFKILKEYILEYPLNFSDENVKYMVQNLSKLEFDDIKYWNPDKIGDIIFNMWD
jgi:hypothetical protein